jgi:RNA polymerase sigma-70 factor (ECF subfamily)
MNGAGRFLNIPDRTLVETYMSALDEGAVRQLYRRHTPALFALACRLCCAADAPDAVQETWIRACAKFGDFRWNSSLRTWLTGILINCVREQRRKRGNLKEDEIPHEFTETVPSTAGARLNLEHAIEQLADGYRDVLILHDVQGYTHEEISGLLGISVGTSKSQLHRARRRIRALIGVTNERIG